jgi:hypothetical protein
MPRLLLVAVAVLVLAGCIPPTFSYPSPQVLHVGAAVTIAPKITGPRLEAHFSVMPSLPSGLSLDPKTGSITGTPAVAIDEMTFVVTARAALGNTTARLIITVRPAAPAELRYPNPHTTRVGEPVNLVPSVVGDVSLYTVSPALPEGLAISATNGVISGSALAVAPRSSYAITASNAGGSTTFEWSLEVTPAFSDLQYFTEVDNPQIFSFRPGTEDTVIFLGPKDTEGAAVGISDILVQGDPSDPGRIVNDALGRISAAFLGDGSRVAFEYLEDSRVIATATTFDGVANARIEIDLTTASVRPVSEAISESQRSVMSHSAGSLSLTESLVQTAASTSAARVHVTVTSLGQLVSGADVVVTTVPLSNPLRAAQYPATELSAGLYGTSIVNFPSAIPPSTVSSMCAKSLEVAKDACGFGTPVATVMTEVGCLALGQILVAIPGVNLSVPAFIVACEAAFVGVAVSCEVVNAAANGKSPFCGVIRELVQQFDQDGVKLSVFARKDGYDASTTLDVPGRTAQVSLELELPLPRFLHTTINDEANTILTVRQNDAVVNVCSYRSTIPMGLTFIFSGSTPHAVITTKTVRHERTQGANCAAVIEGPFERTFDIALEQRGTTLSGSASSGNGGISIEASRGIGFISGTIKGSSRTVVNSGPGFTATFETSNTASFRAE